MTMPKIRYKNLTFRADSRQLIETANQIIAEYQAQGFDLTLRQLYYQFVARGIIPNKDSEYKRLGSVVNDARLAGLIDWLAIVDRTRFLRVQPAWDSPSSIVEACAQQFSIDLWKRQRYRPEVWIEKDALVGVIEGVCNELHVPYFSCRGYTSQSEMWVASQRLLKHEHRDQVPVILHFGDHDPSGIDMSRDIQDRLELFTEGRIVFDRLALNMPQVEEFSPPPNPAKVTDSRARVYIEEFGHESWELDALEPVTIATLIRDSIAKLRDQEVWDEDIETRDRGRDQLSAIADNWQDVVEHLDA